MKNKLFIYLLLLCNCGIIQVKAQSRVTDTLQWLTTHIQQNKAFYIGRPFKLLLDTLQANGIHIQQFTEPANPFCGISRPLPGDTMRTNGIMIFFGGYNGNETSPAMIRASRKVNTHIPYISMQFATWIIFTRAAILIARLTPAVGLAQILTSQNTIETIEVGEY